MVKFLFVFVFFGCAILTNFNTTSAQISLGATLGVFNQGQSYDGQRYSNNLMGISFAGKYGLKENKMRVGLNVGYFFDSEDGEIQFTQPITGLFEYDFTTNKLNPYAGIDIGIYRAGYKYGGYSQSNSDFGLAPVVGVNYGISDKVDLNANLKYTYILTESASTTGFNFNIGAVIMF